jgi:hypothetical protein
MILIKEAGADPEWGLVRMLGRNVLGQQYLIFMVILARKLEVII